jgi:hypothetical protein
VDLSIGWAYAEFVVDAELGSWGIMSTDELVAVLCFVKISSR